MPETAHQLALPLETHRNHYLFSDHYLNELLPRQAVWREAEAKARQALEAITAKYREVADVLPHYNEAQVERHWIQPVLDILGHVYEVQPALPGAAGTPDYAFFADETAKGAATPRLGTAAFWETVLAVGDAKRWDRPLDRRILDGAPDAFTNANPCYQIDYYLRHTSCTWGLVSNGRRWRLYHRDSSYRLDVFYEVNLAQLIEQGDVAAFRYFYLFFRADAFRPDAEGRCWLDTVLAESTAYAVRVGDELTDRVYEALRLLAQGFLDYPGGVLDPATDLPHIHDACLILLYRLLFLFYAESRGLLPLDNPSYGEQYSLKAIKEDIAEKLDAGVVFLPRRATLCDDLKTLFGIIYEGSETLGVPAYNGGLFDATKHPFLEEHTIGDRYLAQAIDLLARAETGQGQGLSFVDYRDLSIRHLGSIYEGLLEYRLQIAKGESQGADDRLQLELVTERGERKATGSYYTPDYIVKYIVEQTLGPLADAQAEAVEKEVEALKARNRGAARRTRAYKDELARLQNSFADRIQALNVLDPAMGSGHFLVEATDYLARRIVEAGVVSEALTDDNEESELSYWRRRVVERCIYGVDLNPLAVELAKLSLWLATVAKGKPLGFLDHHLRCGNSLIGARVADLQVLPVRKKERRKTSEVSETSEVSQLAMWDESAFTQDMFRVVGAMQQIQEYESADLVTVQEKERIFAETVERERRKWRDIADLWTAAYFGLELTPELYNACVQYAQGKPVLLQAAQAEALLDQAHQIWEGRRFFHWEIEFPEVFFDRHGQHKGDAAGFDAVVGNPPYIRQQTRDILEEEFFKGAYESPFGQYDAYVLFVERGISLISKDGLFGYINPNKFMPVAYGAGLRGFLSNRKCLAKIVDFGDAQVFEGVSTYTCLLFLTGRPFETPVFVDASNWLNSQSQPPREFPVLPTIQLDVSRIRREPWIMVSLKESRLMYQLDEISVPLRDLPCRVFLGLASSADTVYVLQNAVWSQETVTGYSKALKKEVKVDKCDTYKLVVSGNIRRYMLEEPTTAIIFPYKDGGLVPVHELGQNTCEYLEESRAKLDSREKGRFAGQQWYQYGRKQAIQFMDKPKLIVPYLFPGASFAMDTDGSYMFNHGMAGGYGLLIEKPQTMSFCLALLNSKLLEWRLMKASNRFQGGFYAFEVRTLEQLPIRRIEFTTPPEEREKLVEEALLRYEAYLEHGEDVLVRAFVAARLLTEEEPEQADIVHDILARLAERMIEMHKQKQAEIKSFLDWLGDYTGRPVDQWALKTNLRCYYEHDWAEMQRILKRNQRKLPKVDLDVDAYRNEPAQKIKQAWETSMETLRPLLKDIEATDRLIDRIVYQLYGLTEEEIGVVEGRNR